MRTRKSRDWNKAAKINVNVLACHEKKEKKTEELAVRWLIAFWILLITPHFYMTFHTVVVLQLHKFG